MSDFVDDVLNRLVVKGVPEDEAAADFVGKTLSFGSNGLNLPKRQLTDKEVAAMRQSWVD